MSKYQKYPARRAVSFLGGGFALGALFLELVTTRISLTLPDAIVMAGAMLAAALLFVGGRS